MSEIERLKAAHALEVQHAKNATQRADEAEAENRRLLKKIDSDCSHIERLQVQLDAAHSALDRARAEIERLEDVEPSRADLYL